MKFSASQLETMELCSRKWLGQFVHKLPIYKKSFFGFGSVLHAAAERFLRGEEDIFPDGWDIDPDTKVRLSPSDAGLVRVLVEKGIESGQLEQRPGGEIEKWFTLQAGEHTLVGKIDYHSIAQRVIEDHKTGKNDNYMKKTGRGLNENLQLQIYSKYLLEEVRKRGEPDPPVITLIHNQYWKEPEPGVRRIVGETTSMEVEATWRQRILPLMSEATELAGREFFDAPYCEGGAACRAFGGCAYQTLCSGQETILTYRARIDTMNSQRQIVAAVPATNPMTSITDFLKKRQTAVAQPALPPTVNPPAPAAAAAAPAAPPPATPAAVPSLLPPWHSPRCPSCTPSGKNAKTPGFKAGEGTPCRICEGMTKVPSADYEWATRPDGSIEWWKRGSKEQTIATTPAPAPVKDAGTKVTTINTLAVDLGAAATVDDALNLLPKAEEALGKGSPEMKLFETALDKRLDELTTPAAPAEAPAEPAKRSPGRPKGSKNKEAAPAAPAAPAEAPAEQKQGFVLLVGAVQVRRLGGLDEVLAEDILTGWTGGYWQKPAFERRDEVTKRFATDPTAIDALAGKVVIVTTRNPDVDALTAALKPHAAAIISGAW